jgi:SAM-dependent methyltransferase
MSHDTEPDQARWLVPSPRTEVAAEPTRSPADRVRPEVVAEIDRLAASGLDVELCRPRPRFLLPEGKQATVDRALAEQVARPDFVDWLFDPGVHPSGRAWSTVAKRAIALHTLHHVGTMATPASGLDPSVYDQPLFDEGTRSARDLIAHENPRKVRRILGRYDKFFAGGSLDDGEDSYGLTSRDYLVGVVDSHAVRTRGDAATYLIRRHLWQRDDNAARMLSVGCGAAAPLFELADELEGEGFDLSHLAFVDHDPIALASVVGYARGIHRADRVAVHRKNFLKTPMTRYVAPRSVDVVDLIGLFEHIPRSRYGFRLAARLLAAAGAVAKPGGVIVLANMLAHRPQQEFFDSVWPRLQQRTITETLAVIAEAGFDAKSVTVRVPEAEGVYAVYAIRTPKVLRPDSVWQRALGAALMFHWPEY